ARLDTSTDAIGSGRRYDANARSDLSGVLTTSSERHAGDRSRRSARPPALCFGASTMSPLDSTHLIEPPPASRSRLDVDEPGSWHEAITNGSDLLVQGPRPIVADLVGVRRIGTRDAAGVGGPNGDREWLVLPARCRHVREPGFPA
ncbi:MAG: hypothetical protein ABSG43_27485, partial [Solirubrobacteraceae bacterium]